MAYEIEHISDHERRVWLRDAIESGSYRQPFVPTSSAQPPRAADRGRGLRALPAQGLPRPEAVLDRGPRRDGADARRGDRAGRRGGAHEVVIGHGPPRAAECSGAHDRAAVRADPARVRGRADDRGRRRRPRGRHRRRQVPPRRRGRAQTTPAGEITVTLCANPSHLEAVDPSSRAAPARSRPTARPSAGVHDPGVALPILIHGDASFAGQGDRRRDPEHPGRSPGTRPAARST